MVSIILARKGQIEDIIKLINKEHWRSNAVMQVTKRGVSRWVKDKRSVVAVTNGIVVGHQALNLWPKSKWAEFRSAVVDERFRGQGIGYKMTKKLIGDFMKGNRQATFVSIKNKTERGNGILLDLGFREISLEDVPKELFTIRSHSERRAFRLDVGK